MTGAEIFARDTVGISEYSQLLQTIDLRFGEDVLYPLLEKAEAQNKRLAIDETVIDTSILDNDITLKSIIFL